MLCCINSLMLLHNLNSTKCVILLKLTNPLRYYTKSNKAREYAKCYRILEVPDNSDREIVRRAFINLCKKYHPDSGEATANAAKFQEVDSAYKLLQKKFAEERWNVDEGIGEYGLYYKEKKETSENNVEIFDIKHTAPQHRQYLSFDGIGSGTPSQRQKQYTKYRTIMAIENVYDHHIKKISKNQTNAENTLAVKDKKEAKKIKTRYGMERLVEDLIQESMANGLFDNLKGQGKPLPPTTYNPYVDSVTQKMNEVMMENGFTPEWIMLQKEIAEDIDFIKEKLLREMKKFDPYEFDILEKRKWKETLEALRKEVKRLNQKIDKYNLVVPVLDKQKLHFDLDKVGREILKAIGTAKTEGGTRRQVQEDIREKEKTEDGWSFFSSFFAFISK